MVRCVQRRIKGRDFRLPHLWYNEVRIGLAASARADMRETTWWIRNEVLPAVAENWSARFHKNIRDLIHQSLRCSLSDENDRFPEEIRVLVLGRHLSRFRIVFAIRGRYRG